MNNTGCEFKVLRTTKKRKVLSMSLWKSNVKYIFNLSNTLLWWGNNGRLLFPDWNIRIYIDYNITKPFEKSKERLEDIDWDLIIENISSYDNIELWFYNCKWGQDVNNRHQKTFGSLVRFHAFQDKDIDYAVCKNIELLSSKKDAEIINNWVNSDKKYLVYSDINTGYNCFYNNIEMCKKLGLENVAMVLATFGMVCKGNIQEYLFDNMMKLRIKHIDVLKDFPYGIDEIFLTKIYKNDMNINNTFIIPRTLFNQVIPRNNSYYDHIYDDIGDFLENGSTLTTEQKEIMLNKIKIQYKKNKNALPPILYNIFSDYPDIAMKLVNYLIDKYQYQCTTDEQEYKNYEDMIQESQQYHIKLFKENTLRDNFEEDKDDDEYEYKEKVEYSFLNKAKTKREAELYFYLVLKTYIIETIDWLGYCLKSKDGYIIPNKPNKEVIRKNIKKELDAKIEEYKSTLESLNNIKSLIIKRNKQNFLNINKNLKDLNIDSEKYNEMLEKKVDNQFTKENTEYNNKKESVQRRLFFAYLSPLR